MRIDQYASAEGGSKPGRVSFLLNCSVDEPHPVLRRNGQPRIPKCDALTNTHTGKKTTAISKIASMNLKILGNTGDKMLTYYIRQVVFQCLPSVFVDNHGTQQEYRLLWVIQVVSGIARLIEINKVHTFYL